jgi:outer membrane protein, multidrug efflux system
MVRRIALVLVCLGAASGLLVGSPALAERGLTLDEALALARAHNRDLQAARARLEQSATNVEQAWAALLPTVSAQGRYTHNYKEVALDLGQQLDQGTLGLAETIRATSTDPAQQAALDRFEQGLSAAAGAPIVVQKGEQLDVGITATVPLLVPYAYPALAATRQAYRASAADYATSEATVSLAVARTYYAAAGADELLLARRNAVGVARRTLDDAKARFQAGQATRVDVMRADVAVIRAEEAEAEAEGDRAGVYRSLGTLLGTQEPLRAIPVQGAPGEPPSDGALVERALRLRPELAFYERSLQASAATARASAWRWAPTLSAFGNAQAFNYQGFSGDKHSWAIGLQLDWTLYDGGIRDAQRHAARAQQREYEARLSLLRDTVTDEVVDARRDLGIKRRSLEAAVRSSELSRETLRLVRVQYGAGKATQLDLLQAQDALVAAEVAAAQARFALALAGVRLERATGSFPSNRREP